MREIADKLIDNFNTASRDVQKVRSTSNLELFMDAWNSLSGYIEELESRITELEAERDQAKVAITQLRDYLYDYTNLHSGVRQEDRWWALVDKFDELTKELQLGGRPC